MHHDLRPTRPLAWLVTALIAASTPTPLTAQVTTAQLDGLRPRNIGPATMSGRIVDLAVAESDPVTFYVASATGGVFKTTDNGITLVPVFEHEGTHSVGAIALHQRDTSIVWVGTGERANRHSSSWGDGVYKSTDGGATWTNMGLRDSRHIGRIALHPDNPDLVFVAAMGHLWGPNEERGLYRSTDGGDRWDRLSGPGVTRGLPEGVLGRIGISIYRSDPRIVYASVEQGYRYNASTAYTQRRAGIYRSEDHGETWEHVSRDGGERWTHVSARDATDSCAPSGFPGLPPGAWVSGIEPSRYDEARVYAVWNNYRNDDYANYLYKSNDYGETWASITSDLPPDRVLRTVREDLQSESVLFLGAEIGLFSGSCGTCATRSKTAGGLWSCPDPTSRVWGRRGPSRGRSSRYATIPA